MSDFRNRLHAAAPVAGLPADVASIRQRADQLTGRRRLATAGGVAAVVLLLGVPALVAFVRPNSENVVATKEGSTPRPDSVEAPVAQGGGRAGDHWHVAYGVYACDQYLPFLEDPGRDPDGIHTHGDGVVHVHPFSPKASGSNARLSRFEHLMGITFDEDLIRYDGRVFKTGDDCNGTPGQIRFFVNGDERMGDPSEYRFQDCDVVVVAFAQGGSGVPPLPWAETLHSLSDMPERKCDRGEVRDDAPPASSERGQSTTELTCPNGEEHCIIDQ